MSSLIIIIYSFTYLLLYSSVISQYTKKKLIKRLMTAINNKVEFLRLSLKIKFLYQKKIKNIDNFNLRNLSYTQLFELNYERRKLL